jgi:AraC-like DNA-binding protein
VYFKADFCSPWGMAVPAKEVAAFHLVVAGACWLRVGGSAPRALGPGHVVLFPRGRAHALSHPREAEAWPAEEVVGRLSEGSSGLRFGEAGGETTRLVCGHFSYQGEGLHPFFTTLPEVLEVQLPQGEQASWLTAAAELAAAESASAERGAAVVVDRLAETLLLQTLRVFLATNPHAQGFLAAVEDPALGRALASIHASCQRSWTVEELARESGISRSSFAERFKTQVGESPMRYLARWRMIRARELLADPSLTASAVAGRVGYASEFAFSRAFKRIWGQGPGALRRSA